MKPLFLDESADKQRHRTIRAQAQSMTKAGFVGVGSGAKNLRVDTGEHQLGRDAAVNIGEIARRDFAEKGDPIGGGEHRARRRPIKEGHDQPEQRIAVRYDVYMLGDDYRPSPEAGKQECRMHIG
jgi:hypothetical protein